MNQKYRDYLTSSKWLIKKAEMINFYLKQEWQIKCQVCDSESNLQVHHESYDTLYDEEIMDLFFLCKDCHKKWHFEEGFKEDWLKKNIDEFISKIPNF